MNGNSSWQPASSDGNQLQNRAPISKKNLQKRIEASKKAQETLNKKKENNKGSNIYFFGVGKPFGLR